MVEKVIFCLVGVGVVGPPGFSRASRPPGQDAPTRLSTDDRELANEAGSLWPITQQY